jgi:3-oxoacyl-[acyl-carrier protein] reductase
MAHRLGQSSWLTGEILDLNGGAHLKRYPVIDRHLSKLMGQ